MINLDNTDSMLHALGGDSVVISIDSFHKQIDQAFAEMMALEIPQQYATVSDVMVCGMGGSRFPALIAYHLYKGSIRVPYTINDDYLLPASVTENTLVVLSSYSGTTEEVLTCAQQALQRKAKIITITSGGTLADWAKQNNLPHYVFNTIHNPSQQPRIGFGYSVGANLGLLFKLGLINAQETDLLSAVAALPALTKQFQLGTPKSENSAKHLAETIYNHYPYYLVSEFLTGIGNAIQNQTNETAKAISSFRVIPELNHHMMEGLKFPVDLKEMAIFVMIHSKFYSEQIQKRYLVTKEVIEKNSVPTVWHELTGGNALEQAFELMAMGSYISMYLSAMYEQDPNAVPYVDYFKKKLKQM